MENSAHMLTVGDFILNTKSRKLYNSEKQEVALQPTLFSLLKYFIDHQNKVLSKDMIMQNVWKGKIVLEANVNQNIKKLRDVLGDSASDPRYIETVTGQGFRFVANSKDYRTTPENDKKTTSVKYLLLLITLFVVFAIVYFAFVKQDNIKPIIKELKPLTTLQGIEEYPTVTKDKKYLLFSHKNKGSWDIYVKPVKKETYKAIIASNENERFPAISHDQSKIIYTVSGIEGCKLHLRDINLETYQIGKAKVIKHCQKKSGRIRAEWINDDEIFISINEDFNTQASIYRHNLNSKEQTLISKPDVKGFGDYVLKYSKKFNKLAYIRNIGWSSSEIWMYDLLKNRHRKILSTSLMLSGLDWDDEGWLYYQSNNKEISRIYQDGSQNTVIARFSSKVRSPFIISKEAVGVVTGSFYVIDVNKYNLEKNVSQTLVNSSFNDYFATAGKDFVVFVSDRSGEPQIWLRNDHGNYIQLTQFKSTYEINWLSVSESDDMIMFGKSGNINIINKNGDVLFDADNYSNRPHKNPVFDMRNNRFIYSTQIENEWNIETRQLKSLGDKLPLFTGVTARPCISEDCLYYFKDRNPILYKYDPKSNSSSEVAEIEILTKSDEWDVYDEEHILYLKKGKKINQITKFNMVTGTKVILLETKAKMFTFDRNKGEIYTNLAVSGNVDLKYFSL